MTRDSAVSRRQVGRALASLASLAVPLFVPRSARAAAFEVGDTTWEGGSELYEIARSELGATRVKAVAVLDWNDIQPEDGVLAVHPLQAMDADDTASFMKAGGRLAILDDYGEGEQTLSRFHIYRVPPPARPVVALRNKAALAIAEPVNDVVAGHSTGPHPVVAHVQQLVTNHPMGLRHPFLTPVLSIRAIGEPAVVVAVAGQVGKGRLFAMSDPSATINQMLRYPGNRAFVQGLVRYLVDDDGATRRQGRLFIVTNRFTEEGSFGGNTTSRKKIDSLIKEATAALADAARNGFPPWTHMVIAIAAALGLATWVARVSSRPYKSPVPRYARRTPLVAQGGTAGRFAVLAAPSSPRSLTLLELKSALYEVLQPAIGFHGEPAPDVLARQVSKAGRLDESAYSSLKDVLVMMHDVESAVVAGRPVNVPQKDLARAGEVVADVLRRVEGVKLRLDAPVPETPTADSPGDAAG